MQNSMTLFSTLMQINGWHTCGNCSANAMNIKLQASVAEGGKPCLTSGEHSEPEGGNEQ